MIHESGLSVQASDWRRDMAEAFTDLERLLAFLDLEPSRLAPQLLRSTAFGLRVPRSFAARMQKGDPRDPLLLQVLPRALELRQPAGFSADPVGDLQAQASPGVLHKYRGRALIIATGACATHCRYCFRRHYPYAAGSATPQQWNAILKFLRERRDIDEVILSGGDPLMVSDERLAAWLEQLDRIGHLRRLRLHTRLPIVLPQRITPELIGLLQASRLRPVIVVHSNHPNELSAAVAAALARLRATRAPLLNQTVLLKEINDSVATLALLSERLFEAGVLPYYLHLLDRVQGAAHFEVEETRARAIHRGLLAALPGYLVPRLVREIAGAASKQPLSG